jgi:DNA-binding protein YbaB
VFGPDGLDFNAALRNSQARMAKAEEVRERMAGLTGHAEAPDGRVKVASTSADPLAELHIDPRAMRMGSEELAAAIRRTARQARADLDQQAQAITADAYGDDDVNPLDALKNKDAMTQSLGEMQEMFNKAGKDAQSMVEQLRHSLGFPGQSGGPQ